MRNSNTFNHPKFNPAQTEQLKFEQLGKVGTSKNDEEVLVEKALIELDEVRNDIIIQKNDDIVAEKVNKSESKTQLHSMAGGITATSFKSA